MGYGGKYSKNPKGAQEMTSRDLSGTSAVPRSGWPPPASYVAFKHCHCPKKIKLGIHIPPEKTTAGASKNQLWGRPLWLTIRHRSQHMPPENNALTRTPISKHVHVNGVIGHQPFALALVFGPIHDGFAVMQGTQLLLAKKPSTYSVSLSKNANAKLVKSSRMETNELQGEAGNEQ